MQYKFFVIQVEYFNFSIELVKIISHLCQRSPCWPPSLSFCPSSGPACPAATTAATGPAAPTLSWSPSHGTRACATQMFWREDSNVHVEVEIEVTLLGVGHGGIVSGVDSCRGDVIVVIVSIAILVMLSAIATLFAATTIVITRPPPSATLAPTTH